MLRTLIVALVCCVVSPTLAAEPLRVATFDVDASPPVGSPLAYNINKEVLTPLTCRGIILLSNEQPIVLCAVDWIAIGNNGSKVFREELAKGAGTTIDRVSVHSLHQHDAVWCDFSADEIATAHGVSGVVYDSPFARDVIRRAAEAVKLAIEQAQPVTHLGLGEGTVEKVASNRRILGPDGKVKHVRWTATTDPVVRDAPEGVIDPLVKSISFWNNDQPIVALTYYATHPQSYYRVAQATPDFPGLARNARQESTGVLHVHFNGAGGNITAGKYNDGSHANRQVLADRVAAGMAKAWERTKKVPLTAAEVSWKTTPVALPPSPLLDEAKLLAQLQSPNVAPREKVFVANKLAWLRRCLAGETIDLGCLTLGPARVLHMPGELFVEYQLAAQQMRPDLFVAMAAYGDYAPWYIGTEIAYLQEGYETGPASLVGPGAEKVMVAGLENLLSPREKTSRLGVEAAARETDAASKP